VQAESAVNDDVVFATRGLVVQFGSNQVLRGIDLTIKRGEVVAILGANGSGKSTLIRTLVGIQPATSGQVIAPDHKLIGFVPQRGTSGGGIPATALEVVGTGLLGKHRQRLPRGWRHVARSALAEVGLADRASEAVIHLSGGQQQRVFIARALVRQPEVLVLDEPMAGVDAASQTGLVQTLSALIAKGLTVVVVLHEIGEFANLLTRAITLRDGQIATDGLPPQEDNHSHHHHDPLNPVAQHRRLAEHETGFPELHSQLAGLTNHHERFVIAEPEPCPPGMVIKASTVKSGPCCEMESFPQVERAADA
jgi:zinc transport system ATP-binding protein